MNRRGVASPGLFLMAGPPVLALSWIGVQAVTESVSASEIILGILVAGASGSFFMLWRRLEGGFRDAMKGRDRIREDVHALQVDSASSTAELRGMLNEWRQRIEAGEQRHDDLSSRVETIGSKITATTQATVSNAEDRMHREAEKLWTAIAELRRV